MNHDQKKAAEVNKLVLSDFLNGESEAAIFAAEKIHEYTLSQVRRGIGIHEAVLKILGIPTETPDRLTGEDTEHHEPEQQPGVTDQRDGNSDDIVET